MTVDDAPDDDAVRQSYNFAPGYYGLVYRADVPDYGAGPRKNQDDEVGDKQGEPAVDDDEPQDSGETLYKLQAMKWGMCLSLADEPTLTIKRSRSLLDQAQPRLWHNHENNQLPR
jgi:SOS response associated peptidase (SRAP)